MTFCNLLSGIFAIWATLYLPAAYHLQTAVKPVKHTSTGLWPDGFDAPGERNPDLEDFAADTIEKKASGQVIHALRTAVNKDYAITCPGEDAAEGCNTIRFEVRPGDYAFNGNRSQIRIKNKFTNHIKFDLRLEKYEYQNEWFSIADWHTTRAYQKAYAGKGKKILLSPLAIQLENSNLVLINRANQHLNKREKNILQLPLREGWNHVDIKIEWADDSGGSITLLVNDSTKKIDGVATTYDMKFPNYFKFGIYRSAKYTDTSVVEFRHVTVDDDLIVPDFSKRAAGEHMVKQRNGLDNVKKNKN